MNNINKGEEFFHKLPNYLKSSVIIKPIVIANSDIQIIIKKLNKGNNYGYFYSN